jgi:NADH-quinone oxidoreductase subunit G
MAKVTIDGVTVEVPDGSNLIRAAELAEIEIPHYCYHPGLSVAGNCRMCLVGIKALSAKQATPLPKLQIACNTTVQDGMVVESGSERVKEARRAVLEFLLINHPIDCPICDQAGECKLQEYYMDYGRYHSRFALEEKVQKAKAVPIGRDIMLDQERCILCTRCVRFLDEFTRTHELTIVERGDHCELTPAEGKSVDNPYSVNVVDICPVGALTSREFRFQSRVWYLDSARSICAGCANGCNIEVHSRGDQIYRLKPRHNDHVNGYWMCDEGRRTHRRNRDPDRLRASLSREGGRFVDLDADAVAELAVRSLAGARRPAVVASADLTMEEGHLLTEILERLGGGPRLVISPATSEIPTDDKLISTDRHPNRRGLLALGFAEADRMPAETDAAIIVRCDPVAMDASWGPLLEPLVATIVVADRTGETTGYADHVLAVATHFESEGTFVNRQGRIQRFEPAVPAPGRAVEGWRALAELLAALGGPRYASVGEVLEALLARLTTREGLGPDWLGASGRDITA